MVIASLVAAGVGLAIDKYSERKARRGERRRSSDGQIDGVTTIVSNDADQQKREQEAFAELQNYAEFQNDLSRKVFDDLSQHDISMEYGGPSLPVKTPLNDSPHYPNRAKLQLPIIISQGNTQNGESCWVRAYPRPLMEFGIDHNTFSNFLDAFDVHIKLSARLEAVNVASTSSGIGWRDQPESFSRAIPAAVKVMKGYQRDRKSNTFLDHVNALTFRPRGLFAMIITSRPGSPLQVVTVSVMPPHPAPDFKEDVHMSSDDLMWPIENAMTSTTLDSDFQERNTTDTHATSRKRSFQQIPSPSSASSNEYQESFDSTSPGRSPFSNLLSSVAKHRGRKNEMANKRVRKEGGSSQRPNTALPNALGGGPRRPMPFGFDLASKCQNTSMEAGSLYLVIVNENDPEDESQQPSEHLIMNGYPSNGGNQNISKRNASKQVKGGMMRPPPPPQNMASSSSKGSFYDPVYDVTAPPAYSQ